MKNYKVGILGFGRAGKAVSSVLLESKKTNLQWVVRKSTNLQHRSVPEFLGVDSDEPGLIYSKSEFSANHLFNSMPVDIIVDFSSEHGLHYYADEAAKRGITIISAISNYSSISIKTLKQLSKKTRVVYSPNITLGINFMIVAAKILKQMAPHADIEIIEEHFKRKPDTSGTAKVITRALSLSETNIKSIRAGGIIGVHEVLFGFPYQTVRLKHESISREAFGNGILFVIDHLPRKKTGFYSMEDLLIPYFKKAKLN